VVLTGNPIAVSQVRSSCPPSLTAGWVSLLVRTSSLAKRSADEWLGPRLVRSRHPTSTISSDVATVCRQCKQS
jgi:hypothetical protein